MTRTRPPGSDHPISIVPAPNPVEVRLGETIVADSTAAKRLKEQGYPPRDYIPREDVRMDLMEPTETRTFCPFKGDATYYAVVTPEDRREDVAWSYEDPPEWMADIKGHLCFYDERLDG
ncbi:hypothetical protein C882_2610 [Caenispirillum salinarum AK4]|uniref:DUF427 domain-containing protein n=1 Tax=Caenispirillum salinarum AK4 TaxID=1238182 RepID=K9HWD3_9PROT|nr:DUF427 domain-containing protein [Caenispirillum salinarum]EKV32531.1 hypothetical protein C882_2610 [Caenispirillum salinarum AK4]